MYLTFDEARKTKRSLEILEKAQQYASLIRKTFQPKFSEGVTWLRVYEDSSNSQQKSLGFLDDLWFWRLWIGDDNYQRTVFKTDAKAIYKALTDYEDGELPGEQGESLQHFVKWLKSL